MIDSGRNIQRDGAAALAWCASVRESSGIARSIIRFLGHTGSASPGFGSCCSEVTATAAAAVAAAATGFSLYL